MSHYRTDFRNLARTALAAHRRFSGFTVMKVWPGSIDADTLPVLGVLTPQDASTPDTKNTVTRSTLLQVAIRRLGGDEIEDELDLDSHDVEAIVTATLRAASVGCFLEQTSVVSNTHSEGVVGTLVMGFRLTSFRAEPTLTQTP